MKVELGDTPAGDALLRRSIEISEHNGADYWAALAMQALTLSALGQGDVPAAVKNAVDALSLLEKAKRPSVLVPIVNVASAAALTRAGRATEALALCDQALTEQEATKSTPSSGRGQSSATPGASPTHEPTKAALSGKTDPPCPSSPKSNTPASDCPSGSIAGASSPAK